MSTLVVTCGLLLATSLGSVHDPSCAHHREGGAGTPESEHDRHARAQHTAGSGAATTEDHGSHHAPAEDSSTECSCPGGLCVLSAAVHLPATPVAAATLGVFEHAEPLAMDGVRIVVGSEEHVQPPGTGPPIHV